ncbi:MAG: glycosyltransferase family 2 protein [Nostoc sp. TH1S01]|nr:glycosyltransferase family 2 protein [Nostoc sp. TH1S01]
MKTPVALLIFNRPDTTEKVFAAIRQAKPPQLLVIADGPRPDRPDDVQNCAAARAIISQVDWDCQVLKNYSDVNLGCGRRVSSGLDWVFSIVERAIILEDDCLPHPSFFRFCEELLEKYQDDERIMTILGTNGLSQWKSDRLSYHFCYWPSPVWGWASWSRAWSCYKYDIKAWANPKVQQQIRDFMADDALFLGMAWRFQKAYLHEVDTWDWQWYFAILSNSGMTIVPSVNLVANIGFGPEATHTKSRRNRIVNRRTYSVEFPLIHPDVIAPDIGYHREITKVTPMQKIMYAMKAKLRPYKHYLLNIIKHKDS